MSGNQVQGPPTASKSIHWQLADTFSLTRSHHRAYCPPAVSFSCLDIDEETSLGRRSHIRNAGNVFKTERPGIFSKSTVNDVCHVPSKAARAKKSQARI